MHALQVQSSCHSLFYVANFQPHIAIHDLSARSRDLARLLLIPGAVPALQQVLARYIRLWPVTLQKEIVPIPGHSVILAILGVCT